MQAAQIGPKLIRWHDQLLADIFVGSDHEGSRDTLDQRYRPQIGCEPFLFRGNFGSLMSSCFFASSTAVLKQLSNDSSFLILCNVLMVSSARCFPPAADRFLDCKAAAKLSVCAKMRWLR